MSEFEAIAAFFQKEMAKLKAENQVLQLALTTMLVRHASGYNDPENYVLTLTAPIVSSFDEANATDEPELSAFRHAIELCNQIETDALERLEDF
ncbi:MAG: hypothetical protein AAF718_16990 [Pseudomonadota bacterium]